jgi:hypothetical protein
LRDLRISGSDNTDQIVFYETILMIVVGIALASSVCELRRVSWPKQDECTKILLRKPRSKSAGPNRRPAQPIPIVAWMIVNTSIHAFAQSEKEDVDLRNNACLVQTRELLESTRRSTGWVTRCSFGLLDSVESKHGIVVSPKITKKTRLNTCSPS